MFEEATLVTFACPECGAALQPYPGLQRSVSTEDGAPHFVHEDPPVLCVNGHTAPDKLAAIWKRRFRWFSACSAKYDPANDPGAWCNGIPKAGAT